MALTHAWHDIVHDMQDEVHDLATITRHDAARQAYLAIWATMVAFPLVFGLDRFSGAMNDHWEGYVANWVNDALPGSASDAIVVFGVVELVLAALVLAVPRIGGDLLALWMALMAINFFSMDQMSWIGMGSLAIAVCAMAMARLSTTYHHTDG